MTGVLSATPTYENAGNPDGSAESAEAVFVNRWAGLKVSKTVTGDMGDRDKPFDFAIEMKGPDGDPLTGSYPCTVNGGNESLIFYENGKAAFQLKHGQAMTVYGLPAGSTYTISEPNAQADGYTTKVTVGNETNAANEANGSLAADATVSVAFENSRGDVPATGVFLDVWPWALAAVLCAAAGAAFAYVAVRAKAERRAKGGKHGAR